MGWRERRSQVPCPKLGEGCNDDNAQNQSEYKTQCFFQWAVWQRGLNKSAEKDATHD